MPTGQSGAGTDTGQSMVRMVGNVSLAKSGRRSDNPWFIPNAQISARSASVVARFNSRSGLGISLRTIRATYSSTSAIPGVIFAARSSRNKVCRFIVTTFLYCRSRMTLAIGSDWISGG